MELPEISAVARRIYDYVPARDIDLPGGLSLWEPSYLLNHLMPAYERATAVYQTLDLQVRNPTEAVSGWKAFKDEVTRSHDSGLADWVAGIGGATPLAGAIVPGALALKAAGHLYAGLIASLYWCAVTGLFGHIAFKDKGTQAFSIHQMVKDGTLSEAEAMAHAGWCYTSFKLMAKLDSVGGLQPLKKGTSGLGAIPVALIVGILIVILIIAGAIVLSKNLSEVNALRAKVVEDKLETMKETCKNATDRAVLVKCAEGPTADDLSAGTFAAELNKTLSKMGGDLVKYLTFGLFAYLGIMLLPSLVGGVKGGVKEATR